jgi:hypothetical protein
MVLLYLIKRGVKATRTRTWRIQQLCITPGVLFVLSIAILYNTETLNFSTIASWLVSLFLGGVLGCRLFFNTSVQVDKKQYLVLIPGNWALLIILMLTFISQYIFGYLAATNPQLDHNNGFLLSQILFSGFFSGILVGRLWAYAKLYQKLPHTDL